MKKIILILSTVLICSCTDTEKATYDSFGKKHKIELYSGGVKVREWISSGITSGNSAGYCKFNDDSTGKLVCVKGDVVVSVYSRVEK